MQKFVVTANLRRVTMLTSFSSFLFVMRTYVRNASQVNYNANMLMSTFAGSSQTLVSSLHRRVLVFLRSLCEHVFVMRSR